MPKFNTGMLWFIVALLAVMMVGMALYNLVAPMIPFGAIGLLIVGIILLFVVGTKGRRAAPV